MAPVTRSQTRRLALQAQQAAHAAQQQQQQQEQQDIAEIRNQFYTRLSELARVPATTVLQKLQRADSVLTYVFDYFDLFCLLVPTATHSKECPACNGRRQANFMTVLHKIEEIERTSKTPEFIQQMEESTDSTTCKDTLDHLQMISTPLEALVRAQLAA